MSVETLTEEIEAEMRSVTERQELGLDARVV